MRACEPRAASERTPAPLWHPPRLMAACKYVTTGERDDFLCEAEHAGREVRKLSMTVQMRQHAGHPGELHLAGRPEFLHRIDGVVL
jgi:hypothetical protein